MFNGVIQQIKKPIWFLMHFPIMNMYLGVLFSPEDETVIQKYYNSIYPLRYSVCCWIEIQSQALHKLSRYKSSICRMKSKLEQQDFGLLQPNLIGMNVTLSTCLLLAQIQCLFGQLVQQTKPKSNLNIKTMRHTNRDFRNLVSQSITFPPVEYQLIQLQVQGVCHYLQLPFV